MPCLLQPVFSDCNLFAVLFLDIRQTSQDPRGGGKAGTEGVQRFPHAGGIHPEEDGCAERRAETVTL